MASGQENPKNRSSRRTSSKSNINCCVYGCMSVAKKNPELMFHNFPKAEQTINYVDEFNATSVVGRRKLWEMKLKMGKPITPYMRVCSLHFVDSDYVTPNEDCYVRRFLKKDAIPSQHLPATKVADLRSSLKRKRSNETITTAETTTLELNETEAAESLLNLQTTLPKQERPSFTAVDLPKKYCSNQTDFTFSNCYSNFNDEKKDVEAQVDTQRITLSDFISTDKTLNTLTGIPSFNLLSFLIQLFSRYKKDVRTHRLTVKERILLVFMKLKLDLPYSALCVFFKDISVSTCKKEFIETVQDLAQILKCFTCLPSGHNNLMNIPKCFQKYQNVRIVSDCTEARVECTRKLCCRIKLYSHYKKNYAVKFMMGVSPTGMITYISPAYGGRVSDKSIFEQSRLLAQLEPNLDAIIVDKGFLIDKTCQDYKIKIIRPPFLRRKIGFNRQETTQNQSIAAARIHVERVNARIKMFKLFRNNIPHHLVPIIDDIFVVMCGIANLSSSMLRDELLL